MIWATVSSWSYFCWLYRASPSLAVKNVINLILVLTIWWCACVESCVVGRGCLLGPVSSLGTTLLAFALLPSQVWMLWVHIQTDIFNSKYYSTIYRIPAGGIHGWQGAEVEESWLWRAHTYRGELHAGFQLKMKEGLWNHTAGQKGRRRLDPSSLTPLPIAFNREEFTIQ